MTIQIREVCSTCGGTGVDLGYPALGGSYPNQGPCEVCNETGYITWGRSNDLDTRLSDLENKVDDILDKCNDIFEQVSE